MAGGLLFSLPLLYTMEVWHAGFIMPPQRQLVYVLAALVISVLLSRADVVVMAAAVADYRPVRTADAKLKKAGATPPVIGMQ